MHYHQNKVNGNADTNQTRKCNNKTCTSLIHQSNAHTGK